MKRFTIFLLVAVMIFSLTACGKSNDTAADTSAKGPTYTVDVPELDPNISPDDYPLIPFDEFEAAFVNLKAANLNTELDGYQDIADIFGVDGAYYVNCDKEFGDGLYKYYGWYADNGVSVLITFKVNGEKLEYFAWTGNNII